MKTKILPVLLGTMFTGFTVNSNAQVNQQLSNLTNPTAVNQSLLPNTNKTLNLGSITNAWKNLFLGNRLFLNGTLTMYTNGPTNFFIGPGSVSKASRLGDGNTATGVNAFRGATLGAIYNTANGYQALYNSYEGDFNTAIGALTLYNNLEGNSNTAVGSEALRNNDDGIYNTAIGSDALYNNFEGFNNTATGVEALYNNTFGNSNTANGSAALYSNTDGGANTAVGTSALFSNTSGYSNTANGDGALYSNTVGTNNTASGDEALYSNTRGNDNTANGSSALTGNTTGINTTAVGSLSLETNTTGTRNTGSGVSAGANVTTGSRNTFIGYHADCSSGSLSNSTALGNSAVVTASNSVRIGNDAVTSIGGSVDWTVISDARINKNIQSNVPGLAFINKLKPVTSNLDLDAVNKIIQPPAIKSKDGKTIQPENEDLSSRKQKEQIIYTGFIAQDVEKAAKELNYDFSGVDAAKNDKDLYGLRYAEFVVPLVKAVQELSQQNEELRARLDKLEKMLVAKNETQATSSGVTLSNARLEQNIPNPFNSITTIGYYLPANTNNASVNFFSSTGTLLKSIQISGGGKGTINLKAGELPAGVYQYSLIINGKAVDSKQMVQIK
jgi:hypothetical protein